MQGTLLDFQLSPTHVWSAWQNPAGETVIKYASFITYSIVSLRTTHLMSSPDNVIVRKSGCVAIETEMGKSLN